MFAPIATYSVFAQEAATRHERFYENGDYYLGTMLDGMRHGRGRYEWVHGAAYEGEYQEDMPHGLGLYVWPNGDQYSGEFALGVRHGQGRYTWGPENYYEGEYRFGERTGVGIRVRDGRTVYEGHFVAGVRQGEGRQVEGFGDAFSGWYEGGVRHGLGVRKKIDGSLWLELWDRGSLGRTWRIERNERCRLRVQGAEWMFRGNRCIDGLAHGAGVAATLDGTRVSDKANTVLGRLMQSQIRVLYSSDAQSAG